MLIRLLAIADNLNLSIMAVDLIGKFLYGPDMIYALNSWGFRLGIYATTVLQHYETWVVIMLTFERYVSVMYPLTANNVLNLSRIKLIMVFILALILVDYIPPLVSYDVIFDTYGFPFQSTYQFGRW